MKIARRVKTHRRSTKMVGIGLGWLALVVVAAMIYGNNLPLPDDTSLTGEEFMVPDDSVELLVDRTYVDEDGTRHTDQQIFDEVMAMIERADDYILVDMFLFNDWQGDPPELTRALASELTEALVDKQQANPEMVITVVSDPLNEVYGGFESPHYAALQRAGINLVVTDLTTLRDSNPVWSGPWRVFVQWWGNSIGGRMPNPFAAGQSKVTVRSWLALLNFKANHRKIVIADDGDKMVTLVTSANPHDGSSAHGNVAVKVKDKLWRDAMRSELAVGEFSHIKIEAYAGEVNDEDGSVKVQLLTEGAIRSRLVGLLDRAESGDRVDMAMFYLSERQIIKTLAKAGNRGVKIRLVLDPNKDAFGRTKNGVPNRPVAHELLKKSTNIEIRWCETHGEQCHTKLVLLDVDGQVVMLAGSANLTRRNIGDYNLETNVLVVGDEQVPALRTATEYFEEIWNNSDGKLFTVSYETYADDSWVKQVLYRVQEASGLSSF